MFRKCVAILLVMFAAAGVAACSSHPDDKGDVSGRNMQNTNEE